MLGTTIYLDNFGTIFFLNVGICVKALSKLADIHVAFGVFSRCFGFKSFYFFPLSEFQC
jgi:hypothetical protein